MLEKHKTSNKKASAAKLQRLFVFAVSEKLTVRKGS